MESPEGEFREVTHLFGLGPTLATHLIRVTELTNSTSPIRRFRIEGSKACGSRGTRATCLRRFLCSSAVDPIAAARLLTLRNFAADVHVFFVQRWERETHSCIRGIAGVDE